MRGIRPIYTVMEAYHGLRANSLVNLLATAPQHGHAHRRILSCGVPEPPGRVGAWVSGSKCRCIEGRLTARKWTSSSPIKSEPA